MLFLIGALAGIAYGLSAFGGSLIGVGLLVLMASAPLNEALSMNLCLLVVMATITAGDGVRARLPVPGLIWPFAMSATLLAPMGVWVSYTLATEIFAYIYVVVLGLAAIATLQLAVRLGPERACPRGGLAVLKAGGQEEDSLITRPHIPYLATAGLGGLLAGVMSASSAMFLLPLLASRVGSVRGKATACAEMATLPVLIAATVTALALGRSLDWRATGLMIFGGLAGLSLARMLAPRCPTVFLHGFIALALATCAMLLGFKALFA